MATYTYVMIEIDAAGNRLDDFDGEMTETQLDMWIADAVERFEVKGSPAFRFGGDDRIYSYLGIES